MTEKVGSDLNDVLIESTPEFLTWYNQVDEVILEQADDVYLEFYGQLESRTKDCDVLLKEVNLPVAQISIKPQ